MEGINFTLMQLDALKEISNIGAGNAATSLSMLVNHKIDMTVPSVHFIKINNLYNYEWNREVYGVIVKIKGDIQGNVLIALDYETVKEMVEVLTGNIISNLSEFENSLIEELGNILCSSYMNSIADFTGLKVIPSVPYVTNNILSKILEDIFLESNQYEEYALDIETIFKGKRNLSLGIHLYYIPILNSLEKVLKTIGVN